MEDSKTIPTTVTEDPKDTLARLRADALLAVATDAAACMQLERLSKGRRKAGAKEAEAVAASQGRFMIHSLAFLAVSTSPIKIASIARRHWTHARDVLRACKSPE